jgi:hypothetical protein
LIFIITFYKVYLDNLGGAHRNGGGGNLTAAVNTIAGSSESTICSAICSEYEDFIVVRGYDTGESYCPTL